MIEAIEQQIINNIRKQYLKNENLRQDIDKEKVAEALRFICSSRSRFYPIFEDLTLSINDNVKINKVLIELKNKIETTYNWITCECIEEIIKSYENPDVKDINKKEEYILKSQIIKEELKNISKDISKLTLKKLVVFMKIDINLNLINQLEE